MDKKLKDYSISNKDGLIVLVVKLINNSTRIYIGGKEVITCRSIALKIPEKNLSALKNIESINDIIDQYDKEHWNENSERFGYNYKEKGKFEITPELDFFVNCSNLEAWVENDYDTRLLDYRLSFPLLKHLTLNNIPRAKIRFKEEILKRYYNGTKNSKIFLEETGYMQYITMEEFLSFPIKSQNINNVSYLLLKDIALGGDSQAKREIIRRYWECNESVLKELIISDCMDTLKGEERKDIFAESDWNVFNELEGLMEDPIPIYLKYSSNQFNYVYLRNGKIVGLDLCVSFLNIKRFPKCIRELDALEYLIFTAGEINELPSWIGKLKHIKYLDLHQLQLKKIPNSIGNLINLEHLDLSYNQLKLLPESFSKLQNLKKLKLYNNKFTTFPEPLKKIKNLTHLHFSHNELNDLPEWIKKLASLEYLDLRSNQLTDIPQTMAELRQLKDISLGFNPLEIFPYHLLVLPNLKNLFISKSNIALNEEYLKEIREKTNIDIR